MAIKFVVEGPTWPWTLTLDDLIGDLEVHWSGLNPNYGVLCDCWQVDPTIRMSAEAQLDAIARAEIWYESQYSDPADRWPEYY